jgi:hypothetical protein
LALSFRASMIALALVESAMLDLHKKIGVYIKSFSSPSTQEKFQQKNVITIYSGQCKTRRIIHIIKHFPGLILRFVRILCCIWIIDENWIAYEFGEKPKKLTTQCQHCL